MTERPAPPVDSPPLSTPLTTPLASATDPDIATVLVPARSNRSRMGRLASAARAAVRASWWTALAGALGAAAIWAALFWGRDVLLLDRVVVGALLLVPPAAAAVLAWTLGGLVTLPGELRDAARTAVAPEGRSGGLLATVWALRGVVVGSTEAWARTAGLARLASLPFVLGLTLLVALNGVLVVAGLAALAWLVL